MDKFYLLIAGLLVLSVACNLGSQVTNIPTETPLPVSTPTRSPTLTETPMPIATATPIPHVMIPVNPTGSWKSEVTDPDTSRYAAERRSPGGDYPASNLFERPFNADPMDRYFPELDLIRARLFYDETWVYVVIWLANPDQPVPLAGTYAVEIDLDVDGRGDFLIAAASPLPEWTTDNVRVWEDRNNDVGGATPIRNDAPASGDGYETLLFDAGLGEDHDLAWARLTPGDANSLQIAFKTTLLSGDYKFTWGVWAVGSLFDPGRYDFNDWMTLAEAGSPISTSNQYPLKALYEIDNTCRWGVGFNPTGNEPGVCPVAKPTPTPTSPPSRQGTIGGGVYYNGWNGTLSYMPGVSVPAPGITVTLRSGSCSSPGPVLATTTSSLSGTYYFNVGPGTYCVSFTAPSGSIHTSPQTVNLSAGAMATVDFYYYYYLGLR